MELERELRIILTMGEVCVVDGCNGTNVIGRGLCSACYHRNRKCGTLSNYPKLRQPSTRTCTVDGCGRTTKALELCDMQYQRQHYFGTTDERINPRYLKGADNCSWVGDKVGYDGAHERVYAARGKASQFMCVDSCGSQAQEWSYRGDSVREMVGPTSLGRGRKPRFLPYSPDPSDYEPRCVRCHRRFDEVALKRWARV